MSFGRSIRRRCFFVISLALFALGMGWGAAAGFAEEPQGAPEGQTAVKNADSGAYDTIAPLVNEETVAISRISLEQFDWERLSQTIGEEASALLDRLQFDEVSKKRTLKEFDVTLERLVLVGEEFLEDFRQRTGLKECWGLIRSVPASHGESFLEFCLVLPADDLTKKQIKELSGFAQSMEMDLTTQVDHYLLLTPLGDDSSVEYYQNIKPQEVPFFRSAFSQSADATMLTALKPFDLAQRIREQEGTDIFDEAKDSPIPVLPLMNLFRQSFAGAIAQFDLNRLSGSMRVEFTDADAAKAVRTELEKLIDSGSQLMVKNLKEEDALEHHQVEILHIFNVFSLGKEFSRGYLRTLLPKQEENYLLFAENESMIGGTGALLPVTGVAVGLLLPAVQAARASAQRMKCTNNLKQMMIAFHNFHDVMQKLPRAYTVDAKGKPLHSWRVLILPYIGETVLYDKIRFDEPWDSEWNRQFHAQMPSVYACPKRSDDGGEEGITHYSVICGEETPFPPMTEGDSRTIGGLSLGEISDGTSNTIGIVEREKGICWMDPTQEFPFAALEDSDDETDDETSDETNALGSVHRDGFHAALMDGSVRFVPDATPRETLRAMATRAGGENNAL